MLICAALLGPPAAAVLFFTALVSVGASLLAALGALDGSPTPVGAAVGAAPPPKSAATWESTLAGASPSDAAGMCLRAEREAARARGCDAEYEFCSLDS